MLLGVGLLIPATPDVSGFTSWTRSGMSALLHWSVLIRSGAAFLGAYRTRIFSRPFTPFATSSSSIFTSTSFRLLM